MAGNEKLSTRTRTRYRVRPAEKQLRESKKQITFQQFHKFSNLNFLKIIITLKKLIFQFFLFFIRHTCFASKVFAKTFKTTFKKKQIYIFFAKLSSLQSLFANIHWFFFDWTCFFVHSLISSTVIAGNFYQKKNSELLIRVRCSINSWYDVCYVSWHPSNFIIVQSRVCLPKNN